MTELRVGTLVVVGDVTLIPLECLRVVATVRREGCWFQVTNEACALVICDAQGPRALDANGQPLAIAYLLEMLPELQTELPNS